MADRFSGSFCIGGKVTRKQLRKLSSILDLSIGYDLSEDNTGGNFDECTASDFSDAIKFCQENDIAISVHWQSKYGEDSVMEIHAKGKSSTYLASIDGEICIRLSDLCEHEDVLIKDYIASLEIPEFPDLELIDDSKPTLRTITVYYSDGDTTTTSINGTDEEIGRHYLGHTFEAGCDTKHHVALLVHFHDTDRKIGVRIKNIESGASGCIADVRRETTKVDAESSFEEVILTVRSDAQYALSDVWVYDLNGEWIQGIGYSKEFAE